MTNRTDTNQASELYELCKKVYELTGWKYTIGRFHDDGSYDGYLGHRSIAYTPSPQNAEWLPKDIPAYTSDYLLEKLPIHLKEGTLSSLYELDEDNRPWCWGYHYDGYRVQLPNGHYAQGWHDTPLKALLTLTIALSEAGELANDQSS